VSKFYKKNLSNNLKKKKNLKILFPIILLLLLKIIFGVYLNNFNPNFFLAEDSGRYIASAIEICKTGEFNGVDKLPEIIRTPGTSFFLLPAICFNLNLNMYIIFLNLLMVLLSAFFTFKLVRLFEIFFLNFFFFLNYCLDFFCKIYSLI